MLQTEILLVETYLYFLKILSFPSFLFLVSWVILMHNIHLALTMLETEAVKVAGIVSITNRHNKLIIPETQPILE